MQMMRATRRVLSEVPAICSFFSSTSGATYAQTSATTSGRVTLASLRDKYTKGTPITAITAYDYPSAAHVRFHCSTFNHY